MFHLLEKRIAEAFRSRIESLYGVAGPAQTEQPKQSSFGEISIPAAFQLARQLKKAPKVIAAELLPPQRQFDGLRRMTSIDLVLGVCGQDEIQVRIAAVRGAFENLLRTGEQRPSGSGVAGPPDGTRHSRSSAFHRGLYQHANRRMRGTRSEGTLSPRARRRIARIHWRVSAL